MKKTVVAVLSVVLILSLSMVALVACNNDEAEVTANSDVLGTAVAFATQSIATGASTAAEEAGDDFQAGINLNFGSNQISAEISAAVNGISNLIQPAIENVVNRVDQLLGENGVKIEKGESDKEDYSQKLTVSGTYVDEKSGEEKTYSYMLYVGINGNEDIEGKKDYTFNAMVVVPYGDEDAFTYEFSGTATLDKEKDVMVFALSADGKEYAQAFAGIKAYGTKNGTVVIELGAGANAFGTAVANASISVELGNIDGNGYGAIVTAYGEATIGGVYGATFKATLNVQANSTENAGEFNVTGDVVATVTTPDLGFIGGKYKATATLNGVAKYDEESDQLNVGVSGNVSIEKVEEEK